MSRPPEDDSDMESVGDLDWLLGFVDPPRDPTDLLRHRFPSKVGGRPAWLDPVHLPTREHLTCSATGQPLQFLAQVYAPVEDNPNSFHRALYLFISPDGAKLTSAGAVRALRCQLPRRNSFYPFDPPGKEQRFPPPLSQEQRELALAQDPWQAATHEQQQEAQQQNNNQQSMDTSQEATTTPQPEEGEENVAAHQGPLPCAPLFPEIELVVEPEPEDTGADIKDPKTKALLQQYTQRTADEGEYTEEELPGDVMDTLEESATNEQRHFAAFASRIAIEPSQVLRYCFDDGAAPLCPGPAGVPAASEVPCCGRCGGPRRFEFQIMPQMLNHLGIDAADPKAPDWGTIAVYSCAASCGGGGDGDGGGSGGREEGESAYVEEWVWVQPPL